MFNRIEQLNWCSKYIEYVSLRKQGLKKQAKYSLLEFIEDYKKQSKTSQRQFIDIVNSLVYETKDYDFMPHNLYNDILLPDIELWIREEPSNPVPYKWSYNLEMLTKALELDPFDQITLSLYGNMLIGKISMNQHEISVGYPYDGNPGEDYEKIDSYQRYLQNINDSDTKKLIEDKLIDLKQCASNYTINS